MADALHIFAIVFGLMSAATVLVIGYGLWLRGHRKHAALAIPIAALCVVWGIMV